MALTLAFSVAEQGDNKLITITDTTGTGTGGWGYSGNPAVGSISTGDLLLNIVVTTSDGTITSYQAIDTYVLAGPFAAVADLVFPITCADLKVGGVAIGTDEDMVPDGIYEIEYEWTDTGPTQTTASVLIDGIVKTSIYEMLRTIPTKYECEDNHERDILDIVFIKGYYDAMIATAIVGRNEQVIEQLGVLERLVLNGSYYSW
jgi:hypothetical protein